MVCLGFEPAAAEWSYGGRPKGKYELPRLNKSFNYD